MPMRPAAVALVAVVLVVSGCGADDEDGGSKSGTATGGKGPPSARTGNGETKTGATDTDTAGKDATKPIASPENQPGGAGDEEPARTQAELTGRGGRIAPRVVRVPPFIAIRVELRSADGRTYELRLKRRALRADRDVAAATTDVAGLRPGKRLVAQPVNGAGNAVVIEASAEPGP